MTALAPEPADRAIARILAGGLDDWRDITDTVTAPYTSTTGRTRQDPHEPPIEAAAMPLDTDADTETLLLADAYGWTPSQIDAMPPYVRRLALDFLSSRTATPRRTLRQQLTALRWRARRALWRCQHRTT